MTKTTEVRERSEQAGKMTALRLDEKTRYFADIATAVTGESLTKLISGAIIDRIKHVTLRVAETPEPFLDSAGKWQMPEPLDPEQERIQNEAKSIANLADLLWDESEYVRMFMLSILAPHIQPAKDRALVEYVNGRTDLRITTAQGYKPNRERINAEWESIKAEFAQSQNGGKA